MTFVRFTEPIQLGSLALPGDLVIPQAAYGLVMFVHGSGTGRTIPRNRQVARALQQRRLATLLFDLLTEEEAQDPHKVIDIPLLSERVQEAMHWTRHHPGLSRFPLGLFGASTGAAAALMAAALQPDQVAAVVSRCGRPDLASDFLGRVQAPTLLIVGGLDTDVLALNQQALRQLRTPKRLEAVPGAGHLIEEPGALSTVSAFAAHWYQQHLPLTRPA